MNWWRGIAPAAGCCVLLVAWCLMCIATDDLAIWINSNGDPGTSESCLRDGSDVYVFVRVPERVTEMAIWDLPASGDVAVPLVTRVPAGLTPRARTLVWQGTASGQGSETLILQVKTQSGLVLSTSTSCEIMDQCDRGGAFTIAMVPYMAMGAPAPPLTNDEPTGDWGLSVGIGGAYEGCDVSYHAGQRIGIRYEVVGSEPREVSLKSVPQNVGSPIMQLDRRTVSPNTPMSFSATVSGGQGVATLLLRADAGAEGWKSCMCRMWVRPASDFSEGFDSGRFDSLPWQTGYESDGTVYYEPWEVISSDSDSSRRWATSGDLDDEQASSLCLAFSTATPGTLSFWYRVSSEASFDELTFYIGDAQVGGPWSGEIGWQHASYHVSAGTFSLAWVYKKDGSASGGEDRVWIDDVTFVSD